MGKEANTYYEFGPFRLYTVERTLKCRNKEIDLENKKFEILLILIRNRGRIVERGELMDAVWPGEMISLNNLDVHISNLKKLLKQADPKGPAYIKNFPAKGFRFMAKVKEHAVPVTAAVLPFKPRGDPKVPEEMGYEMADTLTTKLNKNMSLLVTPAGTVNREYKAHPEQDPLIFAHRLILDYVFNGRIWRERDRVHVNVDLLDVRKNKATASAPFSGNYGQSFDLDDLIYEWMETMLNLNPTNQEKEQSTKRYTDNLKADKYYKKGRLKRFQIDEDSLRKAIQHFKKATKEDPHFARAYANTADTYIFMGMLNLITPKESYAGAKRAAIKALKEDKEGANAHTALAFTKMFFEWQWKEAGEGFARSVGINPNYPVAHMGYAHWYCAQGLFEDAKREIKLALKVDPQSFFINFVRGMVLFYSGEHRHSLELFERTHALNPKSDLPYYGRSLASEYLALTKKDDEREMLFEQADADARRAITLSMRHPTKLMHRVHVTAMWSKRNKALKMLEEVLGLQSKGHYISQYHLGVVYASLEETDLAINCLKKAHKARDQFFFLLGVDPRLSSLRLDPRFKKLLFNIGLDNQK